jgi:GT2 family glycosyltransferase
VVVNNNSSNANILHYFKQLEFHQHISVIHYNKPFNFSAINNEAVKQARGELVCLLNNDTEVINKNWLSEMVSTALQPGIGAVGARLWYPNDTLQHGGIIIGLGGVAGHGHKGIAKSDNGYLSRATLKQSFSAVTAACLVIQKQIYQDVNGLDERLPIAFNDVDFCLRVKNAGFQNVWAPQAELYHHESVTRGYEDTPTKQQRFRIEIEYMKKRWANALKNDPAYSPNLTLDREDFSIAMTPRVESLQ